MCFVLFLSFLRTTWTLVHNTVNKIIEWD